MAEAVKSKKQKSKTHKRKTELEKKEIVVDEFVVNINKEENPNLTSTSNSSSTFVISRDLISDEDSLNLNTFSSDVIRNDRRHVELDVSLTEENLTTEETAKVCLENVCGTVNANPVELKNEEDESLCINIDGKDDYHDDAEKLKSSKDDDDLVTSCDQPDQTSANASLSIHQNEVTETQIEAADIQNEAVNIEKGPSAFQDEAAHIQCEAKDIQNEVSEEQSFVSSNLTCDVEMTSSLTTVMIGQHEFQLNGHLGVVLAESFVSPSAPLVDIISTDATIAQQHQQSNDSVNMIIRSEMSSSNVAHRRLYPCLAVNDVDNKLRPFTDEQLRTLYYNHQLEHLDKYVDEFLKEAQQERHEFHEIVRNYYRSRNHLSGSEHDIESLQKDSKNFHDLVWATVVEKLSVAGYCQDKYKVVGDLVFEKAVFSDESCSQLERTLKMIRNHIHDDLSLYAYEAQLSRLQVESYLFRLYKENKALMDIPRNYPVQALLAHQRDSIVSHQVESIKSCISVLFAFHRKPTKDVLFTKDIRQWILMLVGSLLRLSSLEDHLFILNHVLRCPAGVAKWAVSLIQPVAPPTFSGQISWGGPLLDHYTTMLAMILLPIRQREDFLYQLKVTLSSSSVGDSHQWIIIDSDGEEDEDPNNSWHYLQENDIVSLLNQFPLCHIFNHILFIEDINGVFKYDASRSSETSLLKLFAYSTCLIRLLGLGLKNFTLGRYRQLNKRIGRMIRHIVQYTCHHWISFRLKAVVLHLSSATLDRLQVESDMVLQRSVICILSAQRFGSWQFLAELPYDGISISVIWNLLRMMHQGCYNINIDQLDLDLDIEMCKIQLTDPLNVSDFHDKLTQLQTSEALFLLNTFANMACSRSTNDSDFVEFISREIHDIAYVSCHTREFCSKPGRELLRSISLKHPSVTSFLLQCTAKNIDKIGIVSHFLYRGLSVDLWQPSQVDVTLLRRWLLEMDIQSTENQLARILVENMNWGFSRQKGSGELFLKLSLHQQMAAMLMDVHIIHLSGKVIGKIFTEGQKTLTPSSPSVKMQLNDDKSMANFIWNTILRLRLHSRSRCRTGSPLLESSANDDVVDLATSAELRSIFSGLLAENRVSLASYLVLVMTKSGHRISDFIEEGVDHLNHLIEKTFFIPAINCLFFIAPMFYDNFHLLISNSKFLHCLQMILQTDSSRKGFFSYNSSCPVAHLFSSMIENQIKISSSVDGKPCEVVILFWLRLLTKLENWNKEREIICVIDNLIKSSFCDSETFDKVQELFLELTKNSCRESSGGGFLSSITSWLGSNARVESLMDQPTNSDFVWFAFSVLSGEIFHLETESNLWNELQKKLIQNPSILVDQALLKSLANLRLNNTLMASCLGIYRWAHQAIDTPTGHPLLPLICQKFMLTYLGRFTSETDDILPQRGSAGDRFFVNSAQISLIKKLKKRLKESADHYLHLQSSTISPFYEKLIGLYLTLSFWLDEPRLHDSSLYIPALPEQYQGQLLLTVFQNQTGYWRDFVDMDSIKRDLTMLANDWATMATQENDNMTRPDNENSVEENESVDSISSRLQRNLASIISPPPVQFPKSPIPELNHCLLSDKQNLIFTLQPDFRTMVEHARLYSVRVSKHVDLDYSFVELLHKLFVNAITETVLNVPCRSAFNPTHACKGPAVINCRHESKRRDEIVNRKIEENRASYKQLLIESILTPPQNLCSSAVHVENVLTGLINLCHSTKDQEMKNSLIQVGTAIFYVMTTYVSEETKFYPPTRQFFSYCIEILGQEFIMNNSTQSPALLQTILQTPALIGLLAPNFCPNANPELFVSMYEDMVDVSSLKGPDVAFTLLTKFDVVQWLEFNRPLLSRRTALIECIIKSICLFGKEPKPFVKMVFQVYRLHLEQLLRYQFPDHFGITLKLLLRGSSDDKLCSKVWKDFLAVVDSKHERSNSLEAGIPSSAVLHSSTQTVTCILPKTQIRECLEFLSSYFFQLRVSSDDTITYGLYPKWNIYVSYLAQLMSHLSNNYIITTERECTDRLSTSDDKEQAISDTFNQILNLFTPWILPLNNNGQILLPWTISDDSMATEMVSAWVRSIDILHQRFEERLPALSKNALSLVWSQYVTSFTIKGLPEHLLTVVHGRLVSLSWSKLFPDLQSIEHMVKLIDCSKSCFEFLGNIFSLFDWKTIVRFYCIYELPEIKNRLHVCLFTLLVHFAHETNILEKTRLSDILSADDVFNWDYLDSQNYQSVVHWFINVCQPQCLIIEKTGNEGGKVLTLLRMAAGFFPRHSSSSSSAAAAAAVEHPEAPVKRCSFVRCIVQLICRLSYLKDVKVETLALIINNLLTEVEAVIASIVDSQSQYDESVVLATEVLCLLNNCNPNMSSFLIESFVEWIQSSALSLLLMPIIISSCRCLASVLHMTTVTEACIDTHFSLDVSQTDHFGWTKILSVLHLPELNLEEFLQKSLDNGSFLTLYAYVLQKLPLSQSLDDEMKCIHQLLEWNLNAKPTCENESKLFLWWHKIIELCVRQIDFGRDQRLIMKSFLQFISSLTIFGEDKSSSGFLGAIGLGKRSSFSIRFRLVAKGLAAYLAAQIPSDLSLRLESNAPGYILPSSPRSSITSSSFETIISPSSLPPSQQALQSLAHLELLTTNKQYMSFKQHLQLMIKVITDPRNNIRNANSVLAQMVSPLFPDFFYLATVNCDYHQREYEN